MAGQNWRKNKKGFMVNPEGKTARQVKQEKYAAKKAEAKAKASGGGGGGGASTGEVLGNYAISKGTNDTYQVTDTKTGFSVIYEADSPIGKLLRLRSSIKKAKEQDALDAFDDKKTPAKPANKGSEEKIATQKTKKPSDMSAREMQKEYQQIDDKQAKLTDKLIEAGFSRVTMSEISRRRNENPLFKEYAELSDRAKELTLEAEIRGGPGFRVRDLTSKHKNPYAKKPNKKISNRGD